VSPPVSTFGKKQKLFGNLQHRKLVYGAIIIIVIIIITIYLSEHKQHYSSVLTRKVLNKVFKKGRQVYGSYKCSKYKHTRIIQLQPMRILSRVIIGIVEDFNYILLQYARSHWTTGLKLSSPVAQYILTSSGTDSKNSTPPSHLLYLPTIQSVDWPGQLVSLVELVTQVDL